MNARGAVRVARIGCVLLLPLIVSCGVKVKSLNTDPSFTAKNFRDGGIAILGCTTIVIEDSDDLDLSNRLSIPLRQALMEKQKGVGVAEWGNIRRALGDDKMLDCLKEVHDYGTLEPTTLEDLKGALAESARYLLVHRIESDQLKFHEQEQTSNTAGETESVITGYVLRTERIISTAFSVYDLVDGKRVCEATVEGGKGTRREISVGQHHEIDGVVGTVIDVVTALDDIFGDDDEGPVNMFPPPPSQEEVMKRVYGKFAEQLPASE